MLRKVLVLMLCLLTTVHLFSGCGESSDPPAPTESEKTPVQDTAPEQPTEPDEPDDGSFRMYYDDHTPITSLGGTAQSVVEITNQEVTSLVVGTDTADSDVLRYDPENACLVAVGTGTAMVTVDGTEQLVRVRPAPISLFMITGHSIGAGQCGDATQSVASQPGQVYSSHKASTFQQASEQMGLGATAAERPQGIDAFAQGGGGTIGEGSALAWKWNQLTGEKVWVLNCAVGGSVIPEWIQGESYYTNAVAMYRAAAQVLSNEVAAGHYVLRNTAIIYHSAANFGHKSVVFTDPTMEFWYDSMVNGFKKDLAFDITGDGKPETVQGIGFLPFWSNSVRGSYVDDKPINFYMAISDAYPGCFIAAETMRNWCSDELLKENFPAITYTTQSQSVEIPANKEAMFADDGVHYTQVVYNAAGLELADNLYQYFRGDSKVTSLSIYDENSFPVKDSLTFKRVGATHSLVVEADPCYGSDLTIEVSKNLEVTSPFTVKAKKAGDGYIKFIQDGKTIHKITVTVKD